MKASISLSTVVLVLVSLQVATGRVQAADSLGFEPLPDSVLPGTLDKSAPFLLPDGFQQQLLVSASTSPDLPGADQDRSLFDMLTLNETGVDSGRFLFRTHELDCRNGGGGVSRTDLRTGETVTIVRRPDLDHVDGIRWTPWGTVLFNEEVSTRFSNGEVLPPRPCPDPELPEAWNGHVYEITNPLAEPTDLEFVVRPAMGSIAHEGIAIDAAGNIYGVDEFDSGAIYKFTPSTFGDLSSGQLFALGDLSPDDGDDVGAAQWIPLNDTAGNPFDGLTDPSLDARAAAFELGASSYNRPEDMEIGTLASGHQALYVAVTGTNRVLSIELTDSLIVRDFVNGDTIDLASGLPVGFGFDSPDNLAIDAEGRIYIVEDASPGDVWAAVDADADGVAEGIGRWASLSALSSEPSGLYFNPFDRNEAFINVQHPSYVSASGERDPDDATYRVQIPDPPNTILGDFDHNEVLDIEDIDELTRRSATGADPTGYDLTEDGLVDSADVTHWIRELAGSWIGDANLDLEFDSQDAIEILAAQTYEQDVDAVWSTGDFNGDGRTTTDDLVMALADNGYENGYRPDVSISVPVPGGSVLMITAALLIGIPRRRKSD